MCDHSLDTQIIVNYFYIYFFSSSTRTSGKKIVFDEKRLTRVIFIKTKNNLVYMTYRLIKY